MKVQDRKSLALYMAVACGITWLFWIAALLLGYRDVDFLNLLSWNFESSAQAAVFILFRFGVYGPLVAAVLATLRYAGTAGLKDLQRRSAKWKVPPRWYLFMVLIPVIRNLLVVLIGAGMGIPFSSFFRSGLPLVLIVVYFLYQLVTSGLEEPGWRGFTLEVLQKNMSAEKASWILGILWAVWHYPYVVSLYYTAGIVPTLLSLAGFSMLIIGETFLLTWLYNNTGSVLLAILFHAWGNTATLWMLGSITITNPEMGLIPAAVTWLFVFLILKIYGGETLTRKGKTRSAGRQE